jgi:hypothetical protein
MVASEAAMSDREATGASEYPEESLDFKYMDTFPGLPFDSGQNNPSAGGVVEAAEN